MKDVTLKDFLILFVGAGSDKEKFGLINTDNKSFPIEYRRIESPISFCANLLRSDPYGLLDRTVKYIALLPSNIDIDNDHFDFHFGINYDYGFIKITKSEEGLIESQHLCPAVHIILEDESKSNNNVS